VKYSEITYCKLSALCFRLLKRNMLFLLLILTVTEAFAQQGTSGFRKTDSLTYALYINRQWDQLIDEAEKAVAQGTDYYYLRMRLGIAWYEKQNYRAALPNFEKALKFNDNDQTALQYLYYSYLLSGRVPDAQKILPRLLSPPDAKHAAGFSMAPDEVYIEGGPSFPANKEIASNKKNHNANDSLYNAETLFQTYSYVHTGIRFRLLPAVTTYQGYGNVNAPFTQKIRYENNRTENFNHHTLQNEYYGNVVGALPKGFLLTSAWHFLWYKQKNLTATFDSANNTLTLDTVQNKGNDYVLFLSAAKNFRLFEVSLDGSFGTFNKIKKAQLGVSVVYYPFGNLNLYTRTSLINTWQNQIYDLIFEQMIGGKLAGHLWIEGSFTYGNLNNYAENSAFVVYNGPEKINYKFESVLIFDMNKHLEFSLRYRMLQRESEYFYFLDTENYDIVTTKYLFHSLIGGIKWRL